MVGSVRDEVGGQARQLGRLSGERQDAARDHDLADGDRRGIGEVHSESAVDCADLRHRYVGHARHEFLGEPVAVVDEALERQRLDAVVVSECVLSAVRGDIEAGIRGGDLGSIGL